MSTTFDPTRYIAGSKTASPTKTPLGSLVDPATTSTTTPDPTSTAITYGFGTGAGGLTTQQQKVSDSVQNAFSNSLAQRDRDMQRYQMPQLSSNIENEALQRAIATAGLANAQTNPYGITGARSAAGGGGRGGGGGGGYGGGYAVPRTAGVAGAAPHPGASWQQLLGQGLQGFSALAPLLFGKQGMGALTDKGIVGWAWDKFTGKPVAIDANGQPVVEDPVYGSGSGWGQDVINPANPYGAVESPAATPMYYGQPDFVGPPAATPVDYGGGDIADWSNWGAPATGYMPDWSYWG
jgi:hypothetical protein